MYKIFPGGKNLIRRKNAGMGTGYQENWQESRSAAQFRKKG